MQHVIDQFAETLREAGARKRPVRVRGGGTKDFYGGELRGEILDTRAYAGIVDYEPSELVITARAGTPLAEIEALMREHGQMLGFEPPHFGPGATLGGAVAAGLSGPRRPYAGAARDLVLGVRVLDGSGADLRFGGQVMKNVAGYDVSRLMAGALGTLGVLLEISLKALPLPRAEITVRREHTEPEAIDLMNAWAGEALPVSATCYMENALYARLSGAEPAVRAAREKLGGEEVPEAARFWQALRDHAFDGLRGAPALWRVSIKSTTPPLALPGLQAIEWNGALRWLAADLEPERVRSAAERAGGHATLFRGGDKARRVFHPLSPALARIHARLKRTFDPHGILNPQRMYPEF